MSAGKRAGVCPDCGRRESADPAGVQRLRMHRWVRHGVALTDSVAVTMPVPDGGR